MCENESSKSITLNDMTLCLLHNYLMYAKSRHSLLSNDEMIKVTQCKTSVDKFKNQNTYITAIEFGIDVLQCSVCENSTIKLPLVRLSTCEHDLPKIAQLVCAGEFMNFVIKHKHKNYTVSELLFHQYKMATDEFQSLSGF